MKITEPKIALVGAGGMLSTDIVDVFTEEGIDCIPITEIELDITDRVAVENTLSRIQPDIIINAAAVTDVDGCETIVEKAYAVNADAVGKLAGVAAKLNAFMVHISTDYVFDGELGRAYIEEDFPNPLSIYGKSKAEGEKLLESSGAGYCMIRTQWLYGLHGKNFVETMLRLAATNNELSVVDDQIGSPTFTRDLAWAILQLIESGAEGTFHVTNSGEASWWDFANAIFELSNTPGIQVNRITTEQLNRPAPRPKYSVLNNDKFRKVTGKSLRHWKPALENYLSLRNQKKS